MDETITLAHGNGGRRMRALIEQVFAARLGQPDTQADAAPITLPEGEVLVTTDGFTVQPVTFPGGDIGALAVHGTVNDLAVSGATPLYLTLAAMIEEGFPLALLEEIVASLAAAARAAGVRVVAGDTKVLPRGQGGGIYFTLTGIGVRPRGCALGIGAIRPGDKLLVSGPVGDHGVAVMLAREAFGLRGDVRSDAASVLPLTGALLPLPGLRFMRDATRGGLATVAHEIALGTGHGLLLEEEAIPVRESTRAVCAMLGYDPLYLACEGRVLAVLAPETAEAALAAWNSLPDGKAAALIGTVGADPGPVTMRTPIGGLRILPELEEDALPRIC
ncbi:hydrogenase expression/formation protein HypE [Acidocella sp.]|uniref:hydrogenase expression/formation protein HypE n=1 Tax=Acidocella sp. TaxID=50710 RepID=UPI003CFE5658